MVKSKKMLQALKMDAPHLNDNFAYVLPQREGEPCKIVVPSAVQMGWVESPALFCAVTESVRDLAQRFVDTDTQLPPHEIDE